MKKIILLAITLLTSVGMYAQVGICTKALSLEDNSFVGSLWEPTGTVNYTETDGVGIYGLVISLSTNDTYMDVEEGNKVSIEFTDSTRQVLTVELTSQHYSNTIVSHRVVDIYKKNIVIYPDYSQLTSKELKRIVIQRSNGKVWIINTKPKRAKKLISEFKTGMEQAHSSYKTKVSNDNYFNE